MNHKRRWLIGVCLALIVIAAVLYQPARIAFLQFQGRAALARQDLQNAEKIYLEIYRLKPKDTESNLQLCELFHQQKVYAKSVDFCRRAITFSPKNIAPYLHMAELYFEMGELDYAVSYLEQLMRMDKQNPKSWLLLGRIALLRGQKPQAKLFFQNAQLAVQKAPNLSLEQEINAAMSKL